MYFDWKTAPHGACCIGKSRLERNRSSVQCKDIADAHWNMQSSQKKMLKQSRREQNEKKLISSTHSETNWQWRQTVSLETSKQKLHDFQSAVFSNNIVGATLKAWSED